MFRDLVTRNLLWPTPNTDLSSGNEPSCQKPRMQKTSGAGLTFSCGVNVIEN
jgi:hypothetical protein